MNSFLALAHSCASWDGRLELLNHRSFCGESSRSSRWWTFLTYRFAFGSCRGTQVGAEVGCSSAGVVVAADQGP